MQKPTHLFKLALALPASFLLADAVVAYPCGSVGGEAYNPYSSTVQVSSDANSFGVQWSPASSAVGNGFIGVAIETVNGEQAQSAISRRLFGPAPQVQGVQVVGLLQDGPAQRAGLAQGDILIGVDGQRVTSVQHVQQIIQNTPVGQSVPITFRRGGQVLSTVVVVGDGRVLRPLMLQQQ
ncbi:PDZ domain-containing protein [Synechococcus sp. R50.1]|uniref:PDZ domain-containing protein n=1 Tax=unclassified Synechococcus TaxID=2626047 RepID=UPI0039C0436D